MVEPKENETASRFPMIYEIILWLFYTCFYKYDYYLNQVRLPVDPNMNFPHLQVMFFAIALTLYIIPYYKWILPLFLSNKKYVWLVITTIVYFLVIPKFSDWAVNYVFFELNQHNELHSFFENQYRLAKSRVTHLVGWDLRILFTDIIAYSSVAITSFAFQNERKKHLLARDNLRLQLESLKAQLNPHFLFNTLNSIYSMSVTGNKETPDFILRLSGMMRYILYDCSNNKVPLEKDLEFIDNYFEMERTRYPGTDISISVTGDASGKSIAPLLLIPFAENCFKHGAHRLNGNGYIKVRIEIKGTELLFNSENDIFPGLASSTDYGGVGIKNVTQRLDLYYPGRYKLDIETDKNIHRVQLSIHLKSTV